MSAPQTVFRASVGHVGEVENPDDTMRGAGGYGSTGTA